MKRKNESFRKQVTCGTVPPYRVYLRTNNAALPKRVAVSMVILFFMSMFSFCSDASLSPTQKNKSSDFPFTAKETAMMRYTDDDFTFAEKEARKHATDIALSFEKVDGVKRSVVDPIVINAPQSDKAYLKKDSTPELYIYNFQPAGFAVIGADERSMGELMISASSTLDKTMHDGYAIALDGALLRVFSDREKYYHDRDSIFQTNDFWKLQKKIEQFWEEKKQPQQSLSYRMIKKIKHLFGFLETPAYAQISKDVVEKRYASKFNVIYIDTYSSTTKTELALNDGSVPLLNTDFHQSAPYNNAMDKMGCNNGNDRALAGCVPIAHAQVLLYFNTPATRNRIAGWSKLRDFHYAKNDNPTAASYSYADLTNGTTELDEIAGRFVRAIYDAFPSYINKHQGCLEKGGTGVGSTSDAIGLWDIANGSEMINASWGFQNGKIDGFNYNKITQSILEKSPVLIAGYTRKKNDFWCDAFGDWFGGASCRDKGHQWVVDGVRAKNVRYQVQTSVRDRYFLEPMKGNVLPGYGLYWHDTITSSYTTTEFVLINNQVHNSWGWNKSGGDFSYYKRVSTGEWTDRSVYIGNGLHFSENIKIIPFIKPL